VNGLPDQASRLDAIHAAKKRVADLYAPSKPIRCFMDFNPMVDLLAEIGSRVDLHSSQVVLEIPLGRQIDYFDDIVIDELKPWNTDSRQLQ
jgi:hypothetical protein